jgi:death on curing protein
VRYLTLGEVLDLHDRLLGSSGGAPGLRHLPSLESALALPRQTFGGADLYPELPEKASVLAFSLIQNHPFVDGNKRIGHAAMEAFLLLNDHELVASVEEGEAAILGVASGRWTQDALLAWVRLHIRRVSGPSSSVT